MDGWRRTRGVGGRQRAGFDPSGPHVRQELVGDLGQHFLGQAGHAEDMVTASVNVVAEWDELEKKERTQKYRSGFWKSPVQRC